MAKFTLDDLKAAADAKYGSMDIDLGEGVEVRLLNPLRLPKERRTELMAIQDKLNEDDADQETVLAEAIRMVAETEGGAGKLLAAVGDDLAMLVSIFENYSAGTQAGEA